MNPTGPASGSDRGVRGGSWYGNEVDAACTDYGLNACARLGLRPDTVFFSLGFRVARTP